MLVRLLLFCSGIIFIAGREFKNSAKFTDFIHEAIQVLNTYDDTDLEYFFDIFNAEVRKYHYKGCKFHELIDNADLKQFIAHRLESLSHIPAADIRQVLAALSKKFSLKSYNKHEKELIDLMNSLYRDDSVHSFRTVLNNMELYKYPKSRKDLGGLIGIVGSALRSTIFNHYTELNRNARIALKTKVDELWNDFVADTTSKLLRSFFDGSAYNIFGSNNDKPEYDPNITTDKKEKKDVDDKPKLRKLDIVKHFEFQFSSKAKKVTSQSTHAIERKKKLREHVNREMTEDGDLIYRDIKTDVYTNTTEQTTHKYSHVNTLFVESRAARSDSQAREKTHKYKLTTNQQKLINMLTTARVSPVFRGTTNDNKRDILNKEPSVEQEQPEEGLSIEIISTEGSNISTKTNNESATHVVANFF